MAGVYVHVPFCSKKCSYCDFVSFDDLNSSDLKSYVRLLCEELSIRYGELSQGTINSIYFGGGTPSLLNPDFIGRIIESVRKYLVAADDVEITIEANPESLSKSKMSRLCNYGVNRFSLGVQSFQDEELSALGRQHNAKKAIQAVCSLKDAGVKNFNIDLIFGLPGQTKDSWLLNLETAAGLEPAHISTYPLTISADCKWDHEKNGEPASDDEIADMYDLARKHLKDNGFIHYEISNFAREGFESVHNLNCWTYGDYLGIGTGAHSKIKNKRSFNVPDLGKYQKMIKEKGLAILDHELLDRDTELSEKLILNLRLSRGLNISEFNAKHKTDILNRFKKPLAELINKGLVMITDGRLSINPAHSFIANEVFVSLLP